MRQNLANDQLVCDEAKQLECDDPTGRHYALKRDEFHLEGATICSRHVEINASAGRLVLEGT
jgi:hypothetical protein